MWQADITHWRLAGGGHAEILNMIDDHSRLFLASVPSPPPRPPRGRRLSLCNLPARGPGVLALRDGAVFTATSRGGNVLLQLELERLGIAAKNSRPYHPQTCGKVERLHQTLKRYLERQAPAKTHRALEAVSKPSEGGLENGAAKYRG